MSVLADEPAQTAVSIPLTAAEQTWMWISILSSDSATGASENLRDSGVSEEGTKRLLKYFEDSVDADNLAGERQMLSTCERSAELGTPEVLAKEFERQEFDSDKRRLSIIAGIGRVVDEDDLRGFHASMENHLSRGGKIPTDLPGMIRSGRREPADILRLACEIADEMRKREPYEGEPI